MKHPRLTPLRAFELLRKLERGGDSPPHHVLNEVREALGHHVAAALTAKRRRARRP